MSVHLHIGAQESTVSVSSPEARKVLALGSQRTAAAFFRHTPPTAAEMENAIMAVEDEVIPARTLVAGHADLWTSDAGIRQIAVLCGVPEQAEMVLSVEAVERLFDLLAALVQGRPSSSAGIPNDNGFAATLLILREFMHHLHFAAIRVLPAQAR